VARAQEIQAARGQGLNARLDGAGLEEIVVLASEAKTLLGQAAERMKLSARGYHRLLRVARTIEDLAGGAGAVSTASVAEALSYRQVAE